MPGGSQAFYGDIYASNTASYNDVGEYTDGIAVPTGRAMANGDNRIIAIGAVMYLGAPGSGRQATIYIGGCSLTLNVPNSGAVAVGGASATRALISPGSVRVGSYKSGGTIYFGRKECNGRTVVALDGATWPNWSHAGYYDWAQAPAAPVLTVASVVGLTVNLTWPNPDNGGIALHGFTLHYSKSLTFSSGVTVVQLIGNSTSVTLPDSDTYYMRLASKNEVTTRAGSSSQWSATQTISIATGGWWRNGSGVWRPRVRRWFNGTTFKPVRRWWFNGSVWKQIK